MPRAKSVFESPPAVGAVQTDWPPRNVRAVIRALQADSASPHWASLRETLLTMAQQLRGEFSDVSDDPDDIAQMTLLNALKRGGLAQFGKPGDHLTTLERWSRERFLGWLFQCVRNSWRTRRRQLQRASQLTVDLADWQESNLSEPSDPLAEAESRADMAALVREAQQLLAIFAQRSSTAEAQVLCFQISVQSSLDGSAFDEDGLARRFGVKPGTIRVWLYRVRQYLHTQLDGSIQPETSASHTNQRSQQSGEQAQKSVKSPMKRNRTRRL